MPSRTSAIGRRGHSKRVTRFEWSLPGVEWSRCIQIGLSEPEQRNLQNRACFPEGRVHSLSDSPLDPLERLVRGKTKWLCWAYGDGGGA